MSGNANAIGELAADLLGWNMDYDLMQDDFENIIFPIVKRYLNNQDMQKYMQIMEENYKVDMQGIGYNNTPYGEFYAFFQEES